MKTDNFDYYLPEELIAQHPAEKRDHARLLVLDKKTGEKEDKYFYDIIDYLNPGDVLVMNDTRVIPARLFGHREDKEESIEVFLLHNIEGKTWECLVRPGKKMKIGTKIIFSEELSAEVKDIKEDGNRVIEFFYEGIFNEILDRLGNMPLPPYIKEELDEPEEYQTVYSKNPGSVAAPTAGLHFTKELLNQIEQKGIKLAYLTLNVGLGTFRPVSVEDVNDHKMHSEFYTISQETADIINQAHANGKRVIATGTTTIRTLETVFKNKGELTADSGWTDIFIYPGFEYKVVDALITNFHLPKSTLVMLVAALTSKDMILDTYRYAVEEKYRFFSFGDAMFIH
ncbi:tRNA preQ1(34) S-adenosylmethionine ribosyltransferase-isomerase QueA [Anaerococcus sp. mt242]|uniref:tRNA preQ1(34) S-adenosylmethionine ribosyltransferase-isomerase QueA n=1 Tax=Anaerococcus sp. mt242 TaxID=2661917 RepID=UPI0019332D7A|nr:tRNA preQ1(34) S-adenosylmethionine ribosyltransferase-isomerase QueA [Anaerococcus sp. mt242]MBM0045730.1 tRNA preQ1(34) S-adenosylmethionine ribosyltransferase-isomerase QueA [Anaerococcus sp. mt242]